MKEHFATPEEARAVIDPVLRAWELETYLREGHWTLHFDYADADVVDRWPTSPGSVSGFVHMTEGADSAVGKVTVHVTQPAYPPAPNENFRLTPDVQSLTDRLEGHFKGREHLPSMAYFCLTVVESVPGQRSGAAKKYKIDADVLRKLGTLATDRGDDQTARKKKRNTPPMSEGEKDWLVAAIRLLILRMGDSRSPADLLQITMQDLPPLP